MTSQYEIRVSGRVQGVGFRAAARRTARSLRLRGWVENMADGSVRVMILGDSDNCARFIHWCREGSAYSWVERVDIQEKNPESLGPFTIMY
jgi:acylphosphatase